MTLSELEGEYQKLQRDTLYSTPFQDDAAMCIAASLSELCMHAEHIGDMLEIIANKLGKA